MNNKMLLEIHNSLGIPEDYQKERKLPIFEEIDLKQLEVALIDHFGRPLVVEKETGEALRELLSAATDSGIEILPFSGFRSYRYQQGLIEAQLKKERSIEDILTVLAAPGFSEHHTGRAIDLTTPGVPPTDQSLEETECFNWLTKNGEQFGFTMSYPKDNPEGFIYEPWHWCFNR